MYILFVKWAHVLGAVLFLGTGLGSAYYKFRAWRSGDATVAAWCDAEVVRADWLFTVPSGVLMPVSGLYLARVYGMDWTAPWVIRFMKPRRFKTDKRRFERGTCAWGADKRVFGYKIAHQSETPIEWTLAPFTSTRSYENSTPGTASTNGAKKET